VPVEDWTPTVAEVAAHIRARTKATGGTEAGTFNDQTRPNAAQAQAMIDNAVRSVSGKLHSVEPCTTELQGDFRNAAALRAAMAIEASYYPEQVSTGRSNFAQLKAMFDDDVKSLAEAVVLQCGGAPGSDDEGAAGQSPAHHFDNLPLAGRQTPIEW
jgi:cell pole-organizing protein PopZ